MIPMNRVLIPTDFSELATHALGYACELAKTYSAELHVLHVVAPAPNEALAAGIPGSMIPVATGPLNLVGDTIACETEKLAAYVRDHISDQPVKPVVAVRFGSAWEEITRYAADAKIDLIVIGTHARGMVKRMLLGSVGKAVLEHAHLPVLMVPMAAMEGAAVISDASPERTIA